MSRIIKIRPNYLQVVSPTTYQKTLVGALTPNGGISSYNVITGGSNPTAPSPTGRNPTFIWTGERQYKWDQMANTNHWVYQLASSQGALTGTSNQRYSDLGVWAAWMFQVTGDSSWAQKAYGALNVQPASPTDSVMGGANGVRENFIIACIIADWIYPALSAQQKSDIFAWLTIVANFARAYNTSTYKGGFSDSDTDQLTGSVGGLLLLSLIDVPENSANFGILQDLNIYLSSGPGTAIDKPLGGYTATGVNSTTKRNRLEQLIVTLAAGGIWCESSEYNTGTTRLLNTFVAAYETAVGDTALDNALAFNKDLGKTWRHQITYDTQAFWQWGDEQNPDSFGSEYRRNIAIDSMMCVQGNLASYDAAEAARVQHTIDRACAYDSNASRTSTNAIQRGILLYDPDIVASAPTVPEVIESFGGGFAFHRRTSCNTYFHTCKGLGVHHSTRYGAHATMYRNGGWVLDHPIGYGDYPTSSIGQNSVILNGLTKDCVTRTIRLNESGSDWYALTWRNSGRYDNSYAYGGPPAAFMNYWERRMVSIPSGAYDCIVIQDVVDSIVDATTVTGYTYFLSADKTMITNKYGIFCPIFHSPSSPTVSGNYMYWTAPNGDEVRIYTLTPASITRSTVDQTATNFGGTSYGASEKKYHTLIKQATEATNMTFLHVVIVGAAGGFPSVTNTGDNQVDIGSRQVIFNTNSTTVT